jgi:hypothetical protein
MSAKQGLKMAINVTLQNDEALVLFELLASEKLSGAVDVPERNALWALEGVLEKELAEPFLPEYAFLLENARQSLLARYGE